MQKSKQRKPLPKQTQVNAKPKMSMAEKESLVLSTIEQATQDEPLTLKGIAVKTGLDIANDVKYFCDKLLREKRINMKTIPDAFYPSMPVRAFFRKF